MVVPVGSHREQRILRITRVGDQWVRDEWVREDLGPVSFLPLLSHGDWEDPAGRQRERERGPADRPVRSPRGGDRARPVDR